MKKILLLLFAFVAVSFQDPVANIAQLFEKADTDGICNSFTEYVGIKPPGEMDFVKYNKKQATTWLNNFYAEKDVTGFVQKRVADNEGYTCIYGNLICSGRKYSVSIALKKIEDKYKITSIKFN